MILSSIGTQILIIFLVVVIFIVSVVLNYKTKVPEGVDVPEQCKSCPSQTCMISISKVEEMKKEILNDLKIEENSEPNEEER